MIADQQVAEDVSQPECEDVVAYIINEVLPLLAAGSKEGSTMHDIRPLLDEVDRLCERFGPL
jgi:hypothetical protein